MGLNNLDRFCDIGVTCSPLPPPHCLDMLLSRCCCHFSRHQTRPAACEGEQVIMALILHALPLTRYIDVGTVKCKIRTVLTLTLRTRQGMGGILATLASLALD